MKYIAYCRKSTNEKNKQILSIETQLAELKEFASKEKLEIIQYITESKTAKTPGRSQFKLLLQLIEQGKANGILAWHPDRLARNTIDGGKIVYLLDSGELKSLKFPTFWFENTPQGRFMLNMSFSQAKYYVDNLSENVKRGIRQKLRRGEWPNKPPPGYFNEPRKRTIEVNKKTAKHIKRAFKLFSTGNYSYKNIQTFLFKKDITGNTGKPLKNENIKKMLTNTFYYGLFTFKGEAYQGSHKPLIDKNLFDQCQRIIKNRNNPYSNNKHQFAFLGLAKCAECNSAITAEKHYKYYPRTRGKVRYDYYRCGKKHGPCSQKYVKGENFENQIRNIVFDSSLHPKNSEWILNKLNQDKKLELTRNAQKSKALQKQINHIDQKLDKLLNGYLNEVFNTKEYQKAKNKLVNQKHILEQKLKSIRANGDQWVELVEEFIKSALHAQKIAKAKNNSHELSVMARKVGSNYLLNQRQLNFSLHPVWAELAATPSAARAEMRVPDLCAWQDSNLRPTV